MNHSERKHSKFSASASERWFSCQGSVELSEGLPDKETVWSIQGTQAHEVLERVLDAKREKRAVNFQHHDRGARDMVDYAMEAASFIEGVWKKHRYSELLVETRIHLSFIHPEMFGTFDSAVVDHFGTLHVFDYKYGKHLVSPVKNLQMIFYGLGLAYKFQWNFKQVRLWIVQPRVRGYDGPLFWELPIHELRAYENVFRKAVRNVEANPKKYVEGAWCHFCKAKGICPLKQEGKFLKAQTLFKNTPIEG